MPSHGFIRVAAAVPTVRVGDCMFNAQHIVSLMKQAQQSGAALTVFPELSITGYTCGDLFHQPALHASALDALAAIVEASRSAYAGVAIVGLPLVVDHLLFNVAVAIQNGGVLAVVPKSYLPNYKEFYEARWFAPAAVASARETRLCGQTCPFGDDVLLHATDLPALRLGIEICEDLWMPIPPSCHQALDGALILANLSASNEVIGKAAYRRQLVANQSGRCIAAYVYASCGPSESTTDVVFGGHCLIAENGSILRESPRFRREDTLLVADVDVQRLECDRLRTNSFGENVRREGARVFRTVGCTLARVPAPAPLQRDIDAHPFVPRGQDQLKERCEEIFHTQVAGLAKRLEHVGRPSVAIGVSGGLDSTLALLVTCKTFAALGVPAAKILAFTMPGFGTTARTKGNAHALMKHLGVTAREVDIRLLCLEEMRAMGHAPFGIPLAGLTVETLAAKLQQVPADKRQDLVFENIQARMRTSILMNAGFVIGTGDLSESALGWCTYNGDHMSMYNPNASIPKTLVKFLVRWAAENEFAGDARKVLLDVVDTEISPELLPTAADGGGGQSTEGAIGPYELHDFFLFHFLRYGAPPAKILYLAGQTKFDRAYTADEIARWLRVFIKRFFANQFKRSCLPDGPKVGSISLSPRGDWRMPSDAAAQAWLEW